MKIGYKFSPKEIKKLSKFKNPSVILKKENIVKNGKYKIHLTKNMFNKLLSENKLKYVFTGKRKQYYTTQMVMDLVKFLNLYYHMLLNLERSFCQLLE